MRLRWCFEHAPEYFVGIGRGGRFSGVFLVVFRGLGIRHEISAFIPVFKFMHAAFPDARLQAPMLEPKSRTGADSFRPPLAAEGGQHGPVVTQMTAGPPSYRSGGVAEWFIAAVFKTAGDSA